MDFTGVITSIIDLIKTCIQGFRLIFQLKTEEIFNDLIVSSVFYVL